MPRAAVLDVRKTYRWLADQAKKEGAEIVVKTNIKDVIKDDNGDIIGVSGTTQQEQVEYFAKVIIDASGFPSTVCKGMNLVSQWKRFGAGAEYEAEADRITSYNVCYTKLLRPPGGGPPAGSSGGLLAAR